MHTMRDEDKRMREASASPLVEKGFDMANHGQQIWRETASWKELEQASG